MFNNANTRRPHDHDTPRPRGRPPDHRRRLRRALCAAIKLDEDGETDFVVIEKGADVGGTWRDNTYPGAACDVPSQLYSFSFAPNPDWSTSFSPQPEIQAYIQRVAERSGILDRFGFDTAVERRRLGRRRRSAGVVRHRPAATYAARTLITGAGGLSEPRLPEIEGIETFQGEIFHSARWNHDVDLTGKRVAVIGTGASAIQIVPGDPEEGRPPRRLPAHRAVRHAAQRPALHRHREARASSTSRACRRPTGPAIYWGRECYVPGFTLQPEARRAGQEAGAGATSRKGIADPELREKVTPTFEIGCKRILISNTYYPALDADNVDLVTDGIAKITGDAIVTADGVERPIDVLDRRHRLLHHRAADRRAHQRPRRPDARRRSGASTGMAAYKGTTVAGFPNLFFDRRPEHRARATPAWSS